MLPLLGFRYQLGNSMTRIRTIMGFNNADPDPALLQKEFITINKICVATEKICQIRMNNTDFNPRLLFFTANLSSKSYESQKHWRRKTCFIVQFFQCVF